MGLGKLPVHPVPCRRPQIPGAGEGSEGRRLEMILLAALLASQCCLSAAAGGSAAALERIEDCGTGCSQVKHPPDLGERALPPLIFLFHLMLLRVDSTYVTHLLGVCRPADDCAGTL